MPLNPDAAGTYDALTKLFGEMCGTISLRCSATKRTYEHTGPLSGVSDLEAMLDLKLVLLQIFSDSQLDAFDTDLDLTSESAKLARKLRLGEAPGDLVLVGGPVYNVLTRAFLNWLIESGPLNDIPEGPRAFIVELATRKEGHPSAVPLGDFAPGQSRGVALRCTLPQGPTVYLLAGEDRISTHAMVKFFTCATTLRQLAEWSQGNDFAFTGIGQGWYSGGLGVLVEGAEAELSDEVTLRVGNSDDTNRFCLGRSLKRQILTAGERPDCAPEFQPVFWVAPEPEAEGSRSQLVGFTAAPLWKGKHLTEENLRQALEKCGDLFARRNLVLLCPVELAALNKSWLKKLIKEFANRVLPHRLVLKIVDCDESQITEEKLRESCADLRRMGVKIGIVVRSLESGINAIALRADLVCLDWRLVSGRSPEQETLLHHLVRQSEREDVRLVATRLRSRGDFEFALEAGIRFHQGDVLYPSGQVIDEKAELPQQFVAPAVPA